MSEEITKDFEKIAPKRWKRYPLYKDSGIEWIGEIPKGWKVTKLKWLSTEPLKYGLNEPASESNQNDPRYVRITDITDEGILRDDTFKSIPQDIAKGYLLEEGDLLFARSGATVGKTFIYNHSWGVCCFAGYLIRFRANASKVSARYLYYFTKSSAYWNWLNSSFTKSTIQNASADKYKSLPVSVPNIESQREVLNFLDESCKRIDSLISKKQRLIELLKEKRAAIISRAVTKGLDPNAPMKDSGVEWIGEIPEGWDVAKLKRVVNHVGRGISPKYAEKSSIAVINQACIYWEGISEDDLKYHEETDISELRKGLLKKGDLLLNSTGTGTLGRALLFNLDRVCIADSHVTIVRCNRKLMIPSFLRLLVETPLYQSKILNELVAGSTNQIELSREELRNLIIPLPADEEQQWIVRGITEKTVEIDALISKKQLLIELLKEKRAAIISRAVTKGLDPNAPMKDSGIEWIGEIPEGWKVTKLKWLSMEPLKYGLNEPASESNQNDPRYVRITDITDEGILRDDTFKSIPQDVAKGYLLEEGDLLFARSGATVGKTFIYNHSWGVGCFAGYLIRFRADASKVSARYLYYFTKSSAYWNWLNSSFTKSTIQNASADKYKSLPVSVPNIESQREILNFLDESSKRIDSFISKIEKTIELLKEYRSALITAAVTGKIDVREEVP